LERSLDVVTLRLPLPDIRRVELEDAEAEIAGKQWALRPNLLSGLPQTFLRDVCNCWKLFPAGWLGKLYEKEAPLGLKGRVYFPNRVTCAPGAGKEIEDKILCSRGEFD